MLSDAFNVLLQRGMCCAIVMLLTNKTNRQGCHGQDMKYWHVLGPTISSDSWRN
jgi:hypothetical protein